MSDLVGFFYPRTATGQSSLLPEPPWHYSGDLLTVEYRSDPVRVAELLPAPLEPAPLEEVRQWMDAQLDVVKARFDRLGAHLDAMQAREKPGD